MISHSQEALCPVRTPGSRPQTGRLHVSKEKEKSPKSNFTYSQHFLTLLHWFSLLFFLKIRQKDYQIIIPSGNSHEHDLTSVLHSLQYTVPLRRLGSRQGRPASRNTADKITNWVKESPSSLHYYLTSLEKLHLLPFPGSSSPETQLYGEMYRNPDDTGFPRCRGEWSRSMSRPSTLLRSTERLLLWKPSIPTGKKK